jgi:hypothetical protein
VKVKGVDVFKPQTGEVISDGAEEVRVANEEAFFADGTVCWFTPNIT